MSELFEKTEGMSRVKMMKGIPVTYKEKDYFAPCLYIQETTSERMNAAKKDPRVQTKKGIDEDKLAQIFLASSLVVRACDLIDFETAIERLKCFDAEDMEGVEKLTAKKVFPESKDSWYLGINDLERTEVILGDTKRLSLAFRTVNRLQEEELSSFLDF